VYRVSVDALDKALEHIEIRGDTYLFPLPFEYKAIRHSWDSIRDFLAASDLDLWHTREARRCLCPKQRLGLRIGTQLDPLDTLLITALVIEAGSEIEAARLPENLTIVHSYRFSLSTRGHLYNPAWNFNSFRRRSLKSAADD